MPGAGRRGVHRLEVDAVIHGRIRRRFRAAGRRGTGPEGVVQGAAAARCDRGEEGGVDLAAPGGAGTGTTGGAAAGVVPFEIFNDNGRGRAVARRERRRRVLVLPKGREGVLLRNTGGDVGRRRGPLHAEEDGHDHHLLHPQVHTEQVRHDPEDGDEEQLHNAQAARAGQPPTPEGVGVDVRLVPPAVTTAVDGGELLRHLVVVGQHLARHGRRFVAEGNGPRRSRHPPPRGPVDDEAPRRVVVGVGCVASVAAGGSHGVAVDPVLDEVAGATAVDDEGQSGRGRLEGDVAEGLDARREEEDVGRGVGHREVRTGQPPQARRAGEGLEVVLVRSGADDQGAEAQFVLGGAPLGLGGQPPHHVGEHVRPFLRHQSANEQDDHLVILDPQAPPVLPAPPPRAESIRVDPSAPYAQFRNLIHRLLADQSPPHERRRHVQGLEEVVLVAEEGVDDGLEPGHAGVVVHVVGDVGVEGAEEGEGAAPGVVDDVEAGAIGDGDVDDGGIEFVQFAADGGGEGEPEVVLRGGILRIEQEGDGDGIVEEQDLAAAIIACISISVAVIVWGRQGVRVGGVAAPGREDANGAAGRQDLLLDLADGQGHSAYISK